MGSHSALEEQLYRAVAYALSRVQTDPDFRYRMLLTETYQRLLEAEAAYLDEPVAATTERRSKDLQPEYRRREPDEVLLRERTEKLQARVDQLEGWLRRAGSVVPGQAD
jgi:hypothetical protein